MNSNLIINFNQKLRSNFNAFSLELTITSIDASSSLKYLKHYENIFHFFINF